MLKSLFLWPAQALVEFAFLLFLRITGDDVGISIILLSLTVNVVLLPITLASDRSQRAAQGLRDRMRKKLSDIRSVFRGSERFYMLQVYFRQMGYSAGLRVRAGIGLLVQVPFFIAAYLFLAHGPALDGASFLVLRDLSRPDALLRLGETPINLLPFIMTLLNFAAVLVHTRRRPWGDTALLVGTAAFFLALLYGSPSGMVLYWTVNNLVSLAKALASPALHAERSQASGALDGARAGRRGDALTWLLAVGSLFVLTGLTAPALLMASSPDVFRDAVSLLPRSILQAGSLFLVIPLVVWVISGAAMRRVLAPCAAAIAFAATLLCFLTPSSFAMNGSFLISDEFALGRFPFIVPSAAIILGSFGLAAWLSGGNRGAWLRGLLGVGVTTLILVAGIAAFSLVRESRAPGTREAAAVSSGPVLHFSRTGRNVVQIMLDGAAGAAFPEALRTVPGLQQELQGFTWYANTLSFSHFTLFALPALLGGYDYTPDAINERSNAPLSKKLEESMILVPRAFGKAGYRVSIADPPFDDMHSLVDGSIYSSLEGVSAARISGSVKEEFLRRNNLEESLRPDLQFSYDILFRVSLLRIAPAFARRALYDGGKWWKSGEPAGFQDSMNAFSRLALLRELSAIDSTTDTVNLLFNESVHQTGPFAPDLSVARNEVRVPEQDLRDFGSTSSARYIYTYKAALRELGTWLAWLKEQGIYDTTRIVIVADHGRVLEKSEFENANNAAFNPLLLVKDYGARGPFRRSDEFMTSADVPAILAAGLGPLTNPATGNPSSTKRKSGPVRVFSGPWQPEKQEPGAFAIWKTWEVGNRDIFRKENWAGIR